MVARDLATSLQCDPKLAGARPTYRGLEDLACGKAPRYKMVKAAHGRREQMIGDGLQLKLDLEHWSRIDPDQEPITVDLDLTDDVEWRLNAPDEGSDKKAS